MSSLRPLGYVGLAVVLLIVAMLALKRQGPKPSAAAATSGPAPVLGQAPPADVGRSPAAAQRHVEQQSCLAECEATANLCAASQEEGASAGCAAAKHDCTAKCR